RGILGYINDEAYVVKTVEDVRSLPDLERAGVIAQTTISPKKYQAVVDALREKACEVKVCDTICDATEENQKAIRDISAEGEMLHVSGGPHSANSNNLLDAGREKCPGAALIETADEIDPEDLRGVKRVGISAGASTPDWMIQKVVERLREIADRVSP